MTEKSVEADDAIVEFLQDAQTETETETETLYQTKSLKYLNEFYSHNHNHDKANTFHVITRVKGGTKTHKKLFTQLNLRRPEGEGGLCLTSFNKSNRVDSRRIAKMLEREKVGELVRCVERRVGSGVHVVVTDDVLLSARVNKIGGGGGWSFAGTTNNFARS